MLYTVAKLHYEADLPQVQIARQLGLSTATISRLLQRARADGIVRIEVRDPVAPDVLGAELAERLTLRHVVVVDRSAAGALTLLASPLAALLKGARIGAGAVLALGWGRTIRAVVEAGLPALPGVTVVPATGGMQQPSAHFQIGEFVRLAAEEMQGTPHFLHAPYLPSAEARPIFLSDPAIRDTVALWDRVDVAVLGIGPPQSIAPPHSVVVTEEERALISADGDVLRHYFDATGALVPWEGEDRLIALSVEQLRKVPLSIGVGAEEAKAPSLLGAARAGLVNALVTDLPTAEAMRAMLDAD